MDLSKTFVILNHRSLLAYGLQPTTLKKLENYLRVRFQMTKTGNSYSPWSEIIAGAIQGSNLGPMFVNIFLNGLFLYPEETFLSTYVDDNTLYSIGNTIRNVKKAPRNHFRIIENWFHHNHKKRKDGPNGSFYALTLILMQCHNPFFSAVPQNINKQKS